MAAGGHSIRICYTPSIFFNVFQICIPQIFEKIKRKNVLYQKNCNDSRYATVLVLVHYCSAIEKLII